MRINDQLFDNKQKIYYLCVIILHNTTRMKVKIHHEGTNIILILLAILLAINIPVWLYANAAFLPVAIVSALLWLCVVNFFRSPRRRYTGERDNIVLSSADGKVVAL